MNRTDAEQLALAYCLRNVDSLHGANERRARAEELVVGLALDRYGSSLSAAAVARIRRRLRAARPR